MSNFLEIIKEEIKWRREVENPNQQKREIVIQMYRASNSLRALDDDLYYIDEVILTNDQGIMIENDSYYKLKSNDYSFNLRFAEINGNPKLELILNKIEIIEKKIGNQWIPSTFHHISQSEKYSEIILQLKKMYISSPFCQQNNQSTYQKKMKTSISHSNKDVLGIGQFQGSGINYNVDEEIISHNNSHTSVLSNYQPIHDKKYDFKNKFQPLKNSIGKLQFPQKKIKIDVNQVSILPQYQQDANQLVENEYENEEENKDEDENQEREQSSVSNFLKTDFLQQKNFQNPHQFSNQESYSHVNQDEEEITFMSNSEIDFENLKKNRKTINQKKDRLMSLIPKELRTRRNQEQLQKPKEKQSQMDTQNDLDKLKKKRKFKKGEKLGYIQVDEQKRQKKLIFPNRDYLIVSDSEDDCEEDYFLIKQKIINKHHQFPKPLEPIKQTLQQVKEEKLEEQIKNESSDEDEEDDQ